MVYLQQKIVIVVVKKLSITKIGHIKEGTMLNGYIFAHINQCGNMIKRISVDN